MDCWEDPGLYLCDEQGYYSHLKNCAVTSTEQFLIVCVMVEFFLFFWSASSSWMTSLIFLDVEVLINEMSFGLFVQLFLKAIVVVYA